MTINTEAIDFLKNYCTFFDNPKEVWILKGISRNKDNDEDMDKFISRMIISKPKDIEECYKKIKQMGNKLGTTYRMYVSLNSRDVVKGLFSFQKKLLDISYDVTRDLDSGLQMAKQIGSKWKTELEQMNCRGTKRFLIDIDEDSIELKDRVVAELHLMVKAGKTTVWTIRRTVSGYAVVMDACDIRGLLNTFKDNDVTIQKDSMLFIELWKGED